jgi:HEAT repeats
MPDESINTLLKRLSALDPGEPDSQFEAAIALPKAVTPENRPAIINGLMDALKMPHSLTRAHAAEGLGLLKAGEAVPTLLPALKDRYQLVRSYAARALGKIGDRTAIEPLIEVLAEDPFFGARAEAAEALRYLCANDDSPPSQKARTALKRHRDEELKRKDERGRRVLAEIDITLEDLGAMMAMVDEALKKNKNDYLASMMRPRLLRVWSRLGDLTAPIQALVPAAN